MAAALLTQRLMGRGAAARRDWRSPLVTGLSLALLLRSHSPLVWAGAAAIGVGSKFLLRVGGKPLCNPACLGIVAILLLCPDLAWVSPGQWGALGWATLLLGGAAVLVLGRAARADTALAFFGSYGGLLAGRCMLLGDPWTVPVHQLQSGSLLIFGCFMITDPRSTPDARAGRVLFAAVVALLAYVLQFGWQNRTGQFFALVLATPLVPLLDRILPAERFGWHPIPRRTAP